MTTMSNDDILYAVERRRKANADYRHDLDRAIRRRDEDEIERLIRKAVKKILNVIVDVGFDIIKIVLGW
jgi:hypothetical protein